MPSDPPSRPGPRRQPYAAGDYLTRFPPGSEVSLRLDSPYAKEGWRSRTAGDLVRVDHPGTPVAFEGEFYEVIRIEVTEGGRWHSYYLTEWDHAEALRAPRELSPEACERQARSEREGRQTSRSSGVLRWLSPLVGLLSGEDQRELERRFHLTAPRLTLVSSWCFLLLALGILGCAILAFRQGPDSPVAWAPPWSPVAVYLLLESALRLWTVLLVGEPMGSLPVVLVTELGRALGLIERPVARPARPREPLVTPRRHRALLEARDEVTPLADGPGFEIVSELPKPGWTLDQTPIEFEGRHWVAVERNEVERSGSRAHRYVLRPYDRDFLGAPPVTYRPEEVRDLYRDRLRRQRSMWVVLFGFLFGFASAEVQRRLEATFGHGAELETRRSVVWGGVLAGLAVAIAAAALLGGTGGLPDLMVLAAGGYLAAESPRRWRSLRDGRIAGSRLLSPALDLLAEVWLRDAESQADPDPSA